jgi:hypothetical protein
VGFAVASVEVFCSLSACFVGLNSFFSGLEMTSLRPQAASARWIQALEVP